MRDNVACEFPAGYGGAGRRAYTGLPQQREDGASQPMPRNARSKGMMSGISAGPPLIASRCRHTQKDPPAGPDRVSVRAIKI